MHRPGLGRKSLALVWAGLLFALPARADRILPPEAKPGTVTGFAYPQVEISGQAYRMAPGGKIFDTENRIVIPPFLPADAKVLFLIDMNGNLSKIWILTAQEQARLAR